MEDGYIRDKEAFASALKVELSKRDIHEKEVVFTLSSSKVVTREVMIPFVKDNNILNNYVTFSELAGLKVETFDYIGNGTVQLLCDSFLENAVVVQLEEQATVISILENKKLVFQRVTPYGYGATITMVIDHPVLGIDDEEKALDFLLDHNVIYNRPTVPEMGNQEEMKRQQELANEAYEDLAESLRYHLRIANTAVEYYQNQIKQEFVGNVYLVGDGSRFAGMHKLFAQELPLPLQEIDFTKVIDLKSEKNKAVEEEGITTASSGRRPKAATAVGFLSVIGAAVHPIDAKPKDMLVADSKKNDLHTAYVIFVGAVLVSVLLILGSSVRQLVAYTQHRNLTKRINDLSYVQETYDDYARVQAEEQVYEKLDLATVTKNEQLYPLIEQLENALPNDVKVESIQTDADLVSINLKTDKEIAVGQMLLNFADVTLLQDLSIPSMSEEKDDESGVSTWTYTLNGYYTQADIGEDGHLIEEAVPTSEDTDTDTNNAEGEEQTNE